MIDFVQQLINGLLIGGPYALVALGISLVFGLTGMVSFAHGEIVMLGGDVTFTLTQDRGVPFLFSVVTALLFGGLWASCWTGPRSASRAGSR